MTTNVLILCTHNSARSVLSEGMLNHWARKLGKDVRAYSAGSAPSGRINPHALEALGHAGVDTEGYHRYANEHDLVVLAVGMQPETHGVSLPDDLLLDESGFIEGSRSGGQFAAGAAGGPLDVNRSVQSATAAALRGIQVIHRATRAEAVK